MFITEESFTRRIFINPNPNSEDISKLKNFFKEVWAIENGNRRKSHRYSLFDNVLIVSDMDENILHSEPIENIEHVDIIYNKVTRTGCVKFSLLNPSKQVNIHLRHIQQLDGEDHISTCILRSFYSNI